MRSNTIVGCTRPIALAVLAHALVASTVGAQRVRGVVRDSASGEPIAGAVVTLLDSSGGLASRTLTGNTGSFALPIAGNVRSLSLIRIGFHPKVLPMSLASGHADTAIAVLLSALPTMLASVQIVDQPGCDPREDRAAAFALWEQAREALLATVVARDANPGALTTIDYDRRLDRDGRRIQSQRVRHNSTNSNRPFIAARPAALFDRWGYVDRVGTDVVYNAPDADNLLDPAFAEAHCFSLTRDAAKHPSQFGLSFAPRATHDSVVEITGTVWIDSAARELRTLDFRFTNIVRVAEMANTGGALSFRTAAGVAVIDRWHLHIPEIEHVEYANPRDSYLPQLRVTAMHDIGAEITTASWSDGTHWAAAVGELHGRLTLSDGVTPVAHGLVWLPETDDTARTAVDGTFTLPRLLPGPYSVYAADSDVAVAGVAENQMLRVDVDSTRPLELALRVPTLETFTHELCPPDRSRPRGVVAFARAALIDGSTAANATFDARRPPLSIAGSVEEAWRTHGIADSTGTFHLCDVPVARPIVISTSVEALGVASMDTLIATGAPIQFVRITLRRGAPAP